jgi:hypothetical protein
MKYRHQWNVLEFIWNVFWCVYLTNDIQQNCSWIFAVWFLYCGIFTYTALNTRKVTKWYENSKRTHLENVCCVGVLYTFRRSRLKIIIRKMLMFINKLRACYRYEIGGMLDILLISECVWPMMHGRWKTSSSQSNIVIIVIVDSELESSLCSPILRYSHKWEVASSWGKGTHPPPPLSGSCNHRLILFYYGMIFKRLYSGVENPFCFHTINLHYTNNIPESGLDNYLILTDRTTTCK